MIIFSIISTFDLFTDILHLTLLNALLVPVRPRPLPRLRDLHGPR